VTSSDRPTRRFLVGAAPLLLSDSCSVGTPRDLLIVGAVRESLAAGGNSVNGYDNQILPVVTWTATSPIGTRAQFPVLCCNGDQTWKSLGSARDRF
jgi:hypothetical protein